MLVFLFAFFVCYAWAFRRYADLMMRTRSFRQSVNVDTVAEIWTQSRFDTSAYFRSVLDEEHTVHRISRVEEYEFSRFPNQIVHHYEFHVVVLDALWRRWDCGNFTSQDDDLKHVMIQEREFRVSSVVRKKSWAASCRYYREQQMDVVFDL